MAYGVESNNGIYSVFAYDSRQDGETYDDDYGYCHDEMKKSALSLKKMLVDAISGYKFNSIELGNKMQKRGLAEYTGNQWNPEWGWIKDRLLSLELNDLVGLYNWLDNERKE